jgi:hypothetical protein
MRGLWIVIKVKIAIAKRCLIVDRAPLSFSGGALQGCVVLINGKIGWAGIDFPPLETGQEMKTKKLQTFFRT